MSSRIRRRSACFDGASAPNCGTRTSGVAPRAAPERRSRRSTSRVTATPRSTFRRCGTANESGERRQPSVRHARKPDQPRPEVRPVVVEVSAEERRHEERDHGHRPAKARKFRCKPQKCLVGAVAVDGQVRALQPDHRPDLGRDALVPGQPFAEHHRLAGEQQGRALRIDGLVGASDAISCRVDAYAIGRGRRPSVSGARGTKVQPSRASAGAAAPRRAPAIRRASARCAGPVRWHRARAQPQSRRPGTPRRSCGETRDGARTRARATTPSAADRARARFERTYAGAAERMTAESAGRASADSRATATASSAMPTRATASRQQARGDAFGRRP